MFARLRALVRVLMSRRDFEAGLTEDQWRAADPTGRFAVNVNRPEDLEGL